MMTESVLDNEEENNVPSFAGTENRLAENPKLIYEFLDRHIYSQDEAKKAASMLLYNHMHGIPSNALFLGPTGSGKTEIFRQMKNIYKNMWIFDGSAITQDGWKGNFKIADIFRTIGNRKLIERAIIVIDEADKLFEPKYTSHNENVSYSVQNELLKIIEGTEITINPGSVEEFTFNTEGISFVFMGAFEKLIREKSDVPNTVGFGEDYDDSVTDYGCQFTQDDLIKYAGVRREIAGRINRIVQLRPLTGDDFYRIICSRDMSPITRLAETYKKQINVSDSVKHRLSEEASDSGMGVRYIYSKLKSMLDDRIFEDCGKESYDI